METKCSVCGKKQARTECDNCGTALCGDCWKLEIWGNGAEDLSARYFCPTCKDDPDVNPWGAYSDTGGEEAGLDAPAAVSDDRLRA